MFPNLLQVNNKSRCFCRYHPGPEHLAGASCTGPGGSEVRVLQAGEWPEDPARWTDAIFTVVKVGYGSSHSGTIHDPQISDHGRRKSIHFGGLEHDFYFPCNIWLVINSGHEWFIIVLLNSV